VLTLDAADRRALSGVLLVSLLVVWTCLVVGLALGLGYRAFLWGGGS
jgi:hypothetical protein